MKGRQVPGIAGENGKHPNTNRQQPNSEQRESSSRRLVFNAKEMIRHGCSPGDSSSQRLVVLGGLDNLVFDHGDDARSIVAFHAL